MATTMSKEESKNTRSEHRPEEELNPHWAQSVIPHWSRRSEFPLRWADDALSLAGFGITGSVPPSQDRTIVKVVAPQPDEISGQAEDPTQQHPSSNDLTQEHQSEKEPQAPQSQLVAVTDEPAIVKDAVVAEADEPNRWKKRRSKNRGKKKDRTVTFEVTEVPSDGIDNE
jgi:hypothetical protein